MKQLDGVTPSQSWTTVQECDATGFREAIDGRKLAEYVEERSKQDGDGYGKVENLQGLLRDDVCAVEWLNRLFEFLTDNEFDDVIRSSALVLDQGGNLDKLSNLYRDKEIDDELKDIADSLDDVEIKRAWLRDSRLTALYAEVGKGDRNNNDVVRDIIQELKELADNEDLSNEFTTASVPLFGWLVGKQDWNRLRDLPIFSDNPAIGTNRPLRLSQTPGGKFDSERPLAPVRAWPEGLQCYSSLFPLSHTMADAFYDAVPTPESWKGLKEQGLLHVTVLQRVPRKANFRDHITVNALAEGGGHNAAETGTTTEISFFTRDTEGVMARVRDSRERGQLFWRFLTEWLAVNDSTGLSLTNDSCDCGETHEYYPGLWLVPVKDNRWVQTGNNARETLTARSLAKLFSDRSWDPSLMNEHPGTARLLKAIGVTQLDLALAFFEEGGGGLEDVESHLTQLMSISGGKGMSHVVQFAKDLKFDPDLPDHLAERRKRRKIVHKNQRIGSHVEDLVKESLEREGFTVRRTGIGSDFEIEYDFVVDGQEQVIEATKQNRTWLVEVKAAQELRVRMTLKQAETAVANGDGFLFCVVPIDTDDFGADDVREYMRLVQNIGPLVEPLCVKAKGLEDSREEAIALVSNEVQLEVQSGATRVRVQNTLWQDGIRLDDLANVLTNQT